MGTWKRRLCLGLTLSAFAVVPALLCQIGGSTPEHRYIHVESFRYGKKPSVIRCNRGDWLHLTFSTRDTGHSLFLEEFDVDAKIAPGCRDVLVFRTSEPAAAPYATDEVVLKAEHPGCLGRLVSKSQYRCHVWCGPMHAFEHGDLIIEPNTLLYVGIGLLIGIPVVQLAGVRLGLRHNAVGTRGVSSTRGWDIFQRLPWLKRLFRWRGFQFICVAVVLPFVYLGLLAALFGTQMSGRNLGVMGTWVVWLFVLVAVLTPFGGRIWCLACPLPFLGEICQRGTITGVRTGTSGLTNNQFFGRKLRWPAGLSNSWPRTILLLALGTFSTILVATPRLTGWVILCAILLSLVMALIWELRAFCRYICPVGAFVGLYAKLSKLTLRAADSDVCQKCEVQSCQEGSEVGWACPYGLCVGNIHENDHCGLCTECIKTCPNDNVTIRWRPFAQETRLRGADVAWSAMVMLVLAVAYCLVHLGRWPELRDCVNVLDKANWDRFVLYAIVLWSVALIGLPALMLLLAEVSRRLASLPQPTWTVMIALAGALLPIGLMLWIAFVVPMLAVNASFVAQSASDPFGWGWDFFGTANTPWHQLWPRAVPWIQVACVLVGLHYSLRNAWRICLELTNKTRTALLASIPVAVMLIVFAGSLIWFFAD